MQQDLAQCRERLGLCGSFESARAARPTEGQLGNKRLANPYCQFNLAVNPSEMLIRRSLATTVSLPLIPSLTQWISNNPEQHFIFLRKRYRQWMEIVCKPRTHLLFTRETNLSVHAVGSNALNARFYNLHNIFPCHHQLYQ